MKIEQRILIGNLLGIDITGKPLGELKSMLADSPKAKKLQPIYEQATKYLMEEVPEDRVKNALGKVLADVESVEVVEKDKTSATTVA